MKKLIKIVICTCLLFSFSTCTFASGMTLPSQVTTTLTEVTQVLLVVGAGVCIGKVIQIGIMYVTSSAVDKSNAKSAIMPWLIGTFVCFGAAVIGKFIIGLLSVGTNVLSY